MSLSWEVILTTACQNNRNTDKKIMSSHEKILNSLVTKSIQIRLEALTDPSQVCKPFLVRKMPWNCSFCHSYMYRVNVRTDFESSPESLGVKWCLTPHAFGCTVQCKSNATLCLNISHFSFINGHNKSTIPLAFSSAIIFVRPTQLVWAITST